MLINCKLSQWLMGVKMMSNCPLQSYTLNVNKIPTDLASLGLKRKQFYAFKACKMQMFYSKLFSITFRPLSFNVNNVKNGTNESCFPYYSAKPFIIKQISISCITVHRLT